MASVQRLVPVGNNVIGWGSTWHIAGVAVDNPSGSWLSIPNVGLIPPYTMGWTKPISPAAISIDVLFVDSPSGSVSALVGNDPLVTIYDHAVPDFAGTPSGAGARISTQPVMLFAVGPSLGSSASTLISMLAEPDRRIIVRKIMLAPDLNAGFASIQPFRSLVTATFEPTGGGVGTPSWTLAISPESPFSEAEFDDGTFVLDPGTDLDVVVRVEVNAANSYIIAMAQYYLENRS